MTSLGKWVDKKDSRIFIYVDLEERWEREECKDPRWKEDMKDLVSVGEVQGWMWKMKKGNQ